MYREDLKRQGDTVKPEIWPKDVDNFLVNLEMVIIEIGEIYRLRVEYIMIFAVQMCFAQGIAHANRAVTRVPAPPPGPPPDASTDPVHLQTSERPPVPLPSTSGNGPEIILGPLASGDGRLFTPPETFMQPKSCLLYTSPSPRDS